MLKNYATLFLGVGHGLTKAHYELSEQQRNLLVSTLNIAPHHDRHREAMKALEYATLAAKELPIGTGPRIAATNERA